MGEIPDFLKHFSQSLTHVLVMRTANHVIKVKKKKKNVFTDVWLSFVKTFMSRNACTYVPDKHLLGSVVKA